MTRNMHCTPAQKNMQHPFFHTAFWNDDLFNSDRAEFVPAVNIAETETEFRVEVAAPGFSKENFRLKIEQHVLTISGEVKTENVETKENFSRREFRQGTFSRSFRLPKDKIDTEHIAAKYENGILFVTLPKKAEAAKEAAVEIAIS
ncbi:MAG: Hsp20/alpha crystallin family protein [Bacteroidia bacterium]